MNSTGLIFDSVWWSGETRINSGKVEFVEKLRKYFELNCFVGQDILYFNTE